MARTISIGAQGFADIREHNDFYVDKTGFISQWWNSSDPATLICRPRRFGKTLNNGFMLSLLVELRGRYVITSNRESGYGRYDVMLEPLDSKRDDAIIVEFKVFNPRHEKSLDETVAAAKAQIAEKRYAAGLEARGIPQDRIRTYGFAFKGKQVLIG